MHNLNANMSAGISKKLKRWQRNFIRLHDLKINWLNSTDTVLSITRLGKEWHLRRQADLAEWINVQGWKHD